MELQNLEVCRPLDPVGFPQHRPLRGQAPGPIRQFPRHVDLGWVGRYQRHVGVLVPRYLLDPSVPLALRRLRRNDQVVGKKNPVDRPGRGNQQRNRGVGVDPVPDIEVCQYELPGNTVPFATAAGLEHRNNLKPVPCPVEHVHRRGDEFADPAPHQFRPYFGRRQQAYQRL